MDAREEARGRRVVAVGRRTHSGGRVVFMGARDEFIAIGRVPWVRSRRRSCASGPG